MSQEVADLDTAFDDESKRWFARELYSLKLECEKGISLLIKIPNNRNFQRNE